MRCSRRHLYNTGIKRVPSAGIAAWQVSHWFDCRTGPTVGCRSLRADFGVGRAVSGEGADGREEAAQGVFGVDAAFEGPAAWSEYILLGNREHLEGEGREVRGV